MAMRIPQYWARGTYTGLDRNGRQVRFTAFGWSFTHYGEAKEYAIARAKRIFDHLTNSRKPERYDYLEHPLREEIIHCIRLREREIAVITRNRYGALILNSPYVLFADLDFPTIKSKGFVDSLFTTVSRRHRIEKIKELEKNTLVVLHEWFKKNSGVSARIYRTCAGLRIIFTSRFYDPTSKDTSDTLKALGCDPLYQKLTRRQESFRARLTPKPWRCNCRPPPCQYPWPNEESARAYREWVEEYNQIIREWKTCEFIEEIGKPISGEEIAMIVQLHDKYACSGETDVLA